MSTDPYHAVKQEVDSSLQAAETLRASYLRIRSTASEESEELDWARNEVSFGWNLDLSWMVELRMFH